jgi:hypothetical protein
MPDISNLRVEGFMLPVVSGVLFYCVWKGMRDSSCYGGQKVDQRNNGRGQCKI